jgi:hypothetical protein
MVPLLLRLSLDALPVKPGAMDTAGMRALIARVKQVEILINNLQ